MNFRILKPIFILSAFMLQGCDVVEPIKTEGIVSISGRFHSQEEQIDLSGGLVVFSLHKDKSKGGFHELKLTDLPIKISDNNVEIYVSSTEKVNVIFSIDSVSIGGTEEILLPGTYYFTDLMPLDIGFPYNSALFNLMISRGSGNTLTNYFPIGGTVVVSGTYPDLRVQGEFIMEGNISYTFTAEGRFVTKENFHTFEITSK